MCLMFFFALQPSSLPFDGHQKCLDPIQNPFVSWGKRHCQHSTPSTIEPRPVQNNRSNLERSSPIGSPMLSQIMGIRAPTRNIHGLLRFVSQHPPSASEFGWLARSLGFLCFFLVSQLSLLNMHCWLLVNAG